MKKALNYSLIITGLITTIFCGCKKDKQSSDTPALTTAAVSNINFNTATSGGTITNNGGTAIIAGGICWSKTNAIPTISDSITIGSTTSGSFTSNLRNLVDGSTYYVRAYATNSAGTGYGNVVTFNTIVDTTKVKFTYSGVEVIYGVIISSTTGRKWMDRNLGAGRAATAFNDAQAYGDMFQWGRGADGHQVRTSSTTFTLATTDVPGHANFILNSSVATWYDWRNPQNNSLWQGSGGINNPCPSGWHVPTQAEWMAEMPGITSVITAYSQLKLPTSGEQRVWSDGSISNVGTVTACWTSTTAINLSYYFYATTSLSNTAGFQRANGVAVRCIKN